MNIRVGLLENEQVISLLKEHHQDMLLHSPPESVHALDLTALSTQYVTFYSLWLNSELVGCGALKAIDKEHGEIKSMRTAVGFLRQGVAAKVLAHIIEQAKIRGFKKLSLETGSMDVFSPARKLYQGFGFEICQPFGSYVEDPFSVFMTKIITE